MPKPFPGTSRNASYCTCPGVVAQQLECRSVMRIKAIDTIDFLNYEGYLLLNTWWVISLKRVPRRSSSLAKVSTLDDH